MLPGTHQEPPFRGLPSGETNKVSWAEPQGHQERQTCSLLRLSTCSLQCPFRGVKADEVLRGQTQCERDTPALPYGTHPCLQLAGEGEPQELLRGKTALGDPPTGIPPLLQPGWQRRSTMRSSLLNEPCGFCQPISIPASQATHRWAATPVSPAVVSCLGPPGFLCCSHLWGWSTAGNRVLHSSSSHM